MEMGLGITMHSLALGTGGNLVKSGFIFGFQGVFGPDGASYLQYQINREQL